MRFVVQHLTIYGYSVPIQPTPHILRLTPRPENVSILSRTLHVEPAPNTRQENIDAFGNLLTEVSFIGSTQQLRVDSQFELETLQRPAILQPLAALPWSSDPGDGLAEYRADGYLDTDVQRFALELAAQVGHAPLAFLDQLTQVLFTRTDQQLRLSGDAQPAAATLATWQGTCRDMTVLFMSACRCLGIASRFTSGYLAPLDTMNAPRQLHAWPEVFLPGIGWRGWDPSQGMRVLDAHVPLCAAPTQTATMPIEGGFFFSGAVVNTTLDFDLRIWIRPPT